MSGDALFQQHVDEVSRTFDSALARSRHDGVLIAAGSAHGYFLDDQHAVFHPNPHFRHWVPAAASENCFLYYAPGRPPVLFYHQPRDYWHLPPAAPQGDWTSAFDIQIFAEDEQLPDLIRAHMGERVAYIGEAPELAGNLGIESRNPETLLDFLHYHRARKTPYECECIRAATRKAVRGHLAARDTFRAGHSEFEIHQAYLGASRQREAELPYPNIVALNEHASALHYQHYDHAPPSAMRSFLLDAGGCHRGYAADITRTYSAQADEFADMIAALDTEQQALIAEIPRFKTYPELHHAMHLRIANILKRFDLVDMEPEAMVEQNVTFAFLPHGLGHLLGIQTHDVGGHLASENGGTRPPPAAYPALRLTRELEPGLVFTIEPGLYFIPMLLEALRESANAPHLNWARIETFTRFGGIRIEDNVLITDSGVENFTRDAFAAAESP
ncbi:MAG: Xaa-Pro dipeptidase [Gammaproteobacteria bacterium]|jgi:Xaa-Pro dipeptidase|nr:Xaa-Pro dipeptidase [Gammaproteobacteria bacterium]